jgi:hypothetical protein
MVYKMKKTSSTANQRLNQGILVIPVFLLYHIGLLVSPNAANGADPITRWMGMLMGLSWVMYLAIMLFLTLTYLLVVRGLKKDGKFSPRRFPFVLIESAVYALLMGPLTNLMLHKMHLLGGCGLSQMGLLDRLIASAGAGFYEELIFRLCGIWLIVQVLKNGKMKKWAVLTIAIVITSIIFSAVHYIGAGSDDWQWSSFIFRVVLGAMLGVIYIFRGFATAVYSHFLYDVYVLCVLWI